MGTHSRSCENLGSFHDKIGNLQWNFQLGVIHDGLGLGYGYWLS